MGDILPILLLSWRKHRKIDCFMLDQDLSATVIDYSGVAERAFRIKYGLRFPLRHRRQILYPCLR